MTILENYQSWDQFLTRFSSVNILQTSAWGSFKAKFGWEACHISAENCGAQVLFRKLPLGYHISYIPRGPVGQDWQSLIPEIDVLCRERKTIMLIIEPDNWDPNPESDRFSHMDDFVIEEHTIQPRRTIMIDISGDEELILAAMKQKTRYNIRLAEKKGIEVSQSHDIAAFYTMMHTTSMRDGFSLHSQSYYEEVFAAFAPLDQCVLLQASFEGKPLAALMAFAYQDTAWYFYGASTNDERQRMPTYLLQWEAMRWAKSKGCTQYDLWGIPDYDEDYLEEHFAERNEGLWGVYRFKRGFGGKVMRTVPAAVKVYRPLLYRVMNLLTHKKSDEIPQA